MNNLVWAIEKCLGEVVRGVLVATGGQNQLQLESWQIILHQLHGVGFISGLVSFFNDWI